MEIEDALDQAHGGLGGRDKERAIPGHCQQQRDAQRRGGLGACLLRFDRLCSGSHLSEPSICPTCHSEESAVADDEESLLDWLPD